MVVLLSRLICGCLIGFWLFLGCDGIALFDKHHRQARTETRAKSRPKAAPAPRIGCAYRVQRGLRYGSQSPRQRFDLYRPKHWQEPLPAVLWLHAGGWAGGSPQSAELWALRQVCRGYAVVALGYRVSWEAPFPAALIDVKQGIRWLKRKAQAYALDSQRLALWGASSGAHLASLAALTARFPDHARSDLSGVDATVRAVVHWWGATDFPDYLRPWPKACPVKRSPGDSDSPESKALGCPLAECLEAAKAASPLRYVHADAPPFLIMAGEKDCTVPVRQQRRFHWALRRVGVDSTLVLIPGAAHGDDPWYQESTLVHVDDFLDAKL